jgi:hypothetical protein
MTIGDILKIYSFGFLKESEADEEISLYPA